MKFSASNCHWKFSSHGEQEAQETAQQCLKFNKHLKKECVKVYIGWALLSHHW